MKIWLAYVSYPVTTAVYFERALRREHDVITMGPKITQDTIVNWRLENMKLPVADLDFPLNPTHDMAEVMAAVKRNHFPDLYLWIESVYGYFPENLDVLDCPKACYLIDSHLNLEWHLEWAKNFDFVFLAQREYIPEYKKAGMQNVYWLPLGCDPDVHRGNRLRKKYEIGFVGSVTAHSRRDKLLSALGTKFQVHRERSFWNEMAETLAASKIVFNNAVLNDLNMRLFEAMSAGAFLLTDEAPNSGLTELFVDGEDLAIYTDDKILEKAEYYLQHEQERERIATRGRQLIHNAHTYQLRTEHLLQVVTGTRRDTPDAAELRALSLAEKTVPASMHKNTGRSFIIPVLDMSSSSEYNFDTLLKNLEGIPGEVVVIFNSKEVADRYAGHPRITFSASMSHNVGVARAWNIGLDMCTTPTAFILNADLFITPDAIDAMEKYLHSLPEAAIVGPQGGFFNFATAEDILYFEQGKAPAPLAVDNVSGFFFAVKTQLFQNGTLFFEHAYTPCYFEEWDLSLQIREKGLKAYVVPVTGYFHEFHTKNRTGLLSYLNKQEPVIDISERNQKFFWTKWLNKAETDPRGRALLESGWRGYVLSLAEQAEAKDEFDQARSYYSSLIKNNENDAEVWNRLGILVLRKGFLPAAGEAFEKALSIDPGYEPAKNNLEQLRRLAGMKKND